jgi:hypothetical protein
MRSTLVIVLVALITFAYVLVRFLNAVRFVDRFERRRANGALAIGVVAPPFVAFPVARADISGQDLRTIVLGAALWVTIAMAFAAFAVSRAQWARTVSAFHRAEPAVH